ncbi:hypothetical protein ACI2IX_20195 [Leifsonia aquatica]
MTCETEEVLDAAGDYRFTVLLSVVGVDGRRVDGQTWRRVERILGIR